MLESRDGPTSCLCFFNSIDNISQLSEAVFCDRAISLNDAAGAIKYLKVNRSPGTDGLTAELYKQFTDSLAPFLLEVFKESIDWGALPPTLFQGLITLIPKPKKKSKKQKNLYS